MSQVKLEHLYKRFGNVTAVGDFNLDVKDGEFISFLGPSGCGKTTTLRMIAGFERPTEGSIILGDTVVSSASEGLFMAPEKRDIGMVFQSYAVWPHMTVAENVAYPLKIQGVSKAERDRRVEEALKMVHLDQYGRRYPNQLSGGQQQRVALARALIAHPGLLLLDEPLSNLDAKLRESMRFEISTLQKELGITVIYVTHDQSEAMTMSDRIVVMNGGEIQQIGRPLMSIPILPIRWWLILLVLSISYLLRCGVIGPLSRILPFLSLMRREFLKEMALLLFVLKM